MQNKIAIARLNKIVFAINDKRVIARQKKVNIQIDMATLQERLADLLSLQIYRELTFYF